MKTGNVYLTKDYYSLGHFSKFVHQNAHHHKVTGSYLYPDKTGVQATGFVNDSGERIIIIENKIYSELAIHLSFSSSLKNWTGIVPSRSITTWIM